MSEDLLVLAFLLVSPSLQSSACAELSLTHYSCRTMTAREIQQLIPIAGTQSPGDLGTTSSLDYPHPQAAPGSILQDLPTLGWISCHAQSPPCLRPGRL